MWQSDNLVFDGSGKLAGTSKALPWTLSGVDIISVVLEPTRLLLTGRRVGVEFRKNIPTRIALEQPKILHSGSETIHIEIQSPPDGDYTQSLTAIFVYGLPNLVPLMPAYWQEFAQQSLLTSSGPPPAPSGTTSRAPVGVFLVGGDVKAPVVISSAGPQFSDAARILKYTGSSLVGIEVDEAGRPNQFKVVRPLGLGLDEQALAAASQYTFHPALRKGVPVRVQMNVTVTFETL